MPSTRLNARLRRLEATVAAAGCPAGRDRRGRVVLRTTRQSAEGKVLSDDEPRPCGLCGEVPEEDIEIVEVVVATRDEVAAWQAGPSASCGEVAGRHSRHKGIR
jgi:hypothetical protein